MALYLVGTPIGNLGDLTQRAVDALKSADRIAAEDTRRTRGLLSHLGITGKSLVSVDAHAGAAKLGALLDHAESGENVVFVTDAGMPGVSDPGGALVRAAAARGISVSVIPGPSAVTAAVAASGLVDSAFVFLGFLPRAGGKRRDALERVARTLEPVVLFEAPNRTAATLAELAASAPERPVAVCRELTKLHEETLRGTLVELALPEREWRGEIVIVLGPGRAAPATVPADLDDRIRELVSGGASTRDVVAALLPASGLSRRELYARVERVKAGGPRGLRRP